MNNTKRILWAAASAFLLAGCTDNTIDAGPVEKSQHLAFEYWVLDSDPQTVSDLGRRFAAGELDFDRPEDWAGDTRACEYEASFAIVPEQRDPDTNLDEYTQPPTLNVFGNRNSPGFNFLVYGAQARNQSEVCENLEQTIQGIQLVSSPGHASRDWHDGDTASVVMRPDLGRNYLGDPVEFHSRNESTQLVFQHAVDTVDAGNHHLQGRFRFVATSADGRRLVVVNNGSFGMNNRP